MKDMKLAVLGAHGRGRISIMAHRPGEGFHLVAASGHTTDGLDIYREKCGDSIRLTADYREIIADKNIDAVFICTPDYLHLEHTLAALQAGKTVFLEKPMAISIEDCDAILAAAESKQGRLYVGHNMRFFPVMRKMHELISEGRIGKVETIWCRHFVGMGGDAYFKNYNSERKYSNSLLLQKGAHDIDIIHWLAGGHTRRVVGMGKLSVYNRVENRRSADEFAPRGEITQVNWPPLSQTGLSPVINVEDLSMILMDLDNGVQASYMQCHYAPDTHRNYTVIGTEGRIENYGHASNRDNWATVHLWNQRTTYSELGHEIFRIPFIEGSHGGADPLMIDDFLNFLRGQECAESATPWDARMAVATGCQGARSLREGSIPLSVS